MWRRSAYGGEVPDVRARLADPQSVRPAPDPAHRAGGRQGGDGVGCRDPADHRLRDLQERLDRFVFRSGFIMKPVFTQAKTAPKRVVYAEGEDERILRATQVVVEEGLA